MAREKVGGKKSPLNTWVKSKSGKKGVKYYTARDASGNKAVMKVTKLNKGTAHVQTKDQYGGDSQIYARGVNATVKNPYKSINPVRAQRSASKAQPRNAFESGRYKKLIG